MRYHISFSIQRALAMTTNRHNWPKLRRMFAVESIPDLRSELKEMQADGMEVIPGADCDNKNKAGVCQGHPSEKAAA